MIGQRSQMAIKQVCGDKKGIASSYFVGMDPHCACLPFLAYLACMPQNTSGRVTIVQFMPLMQAADEAHGRPVTGLRLSNTSYNACCVHRSPDIPRRVSLQQHIPAPHLRCTFISRSVPPWQSLGHLLGDTSCTAFWRFTTTDE